MRSLKTKKSLRETLAANQRAIDAYARMAGMEPLPPAMILAPKRAAPTPSGKPLEADVIRAVADLLATHPKVLFAVRQNSGMAYNDGNAPIWFYKWARSRTKMRISDFWGMLTDGRMFAIECKRPGWKTPTGSREIEQRDFLLTVKYAGGVGLFITDASEVIF